MATYTLNCLSCGNSFTGARRTARYCSDRCRNRARNPLDDLAAPPVPIDDMAKGYIPLTAKERERGRVYVWQRSRYAMPELSVRDRRGLIIAGPYKGRSLRELAISAYREGWLAYCLRENGWHTAEWWPEKGVLTMCGPVAQPLFGVIAEVHRVMHVWGFKLPTLST